ncbi:hypothetical protein M9H77_09991 [Catharanthus roseus]|uniref:Uncharacterized protein n=1 Tax=Catharanthus roseus TaxID=4058 RepID=A0ACC0C2C2_CATRO|nr:hypothetical protein M9H77_09991 [Catharanthus roseus]
MSWKKLKLIGRGSYGSVYLAGEATTTGSLMAVKSCDFSVSSSLQLEEKLLQQLSNCPFVIQGIGTDVSIEEGGRRVYNLLLEYASNGSLDKLIKSHKENKMSESQIAFYAFMLLKGLSNIHKKSIVHCDLKPANILVIPRKGINLLKIADFGMSKKGEENQESDLFWGLNLNKKSGDIWALGCIIVEMITGKVSCGLIEIADLIRKITNKEHVFDMSEDVQDFLMKCLEIDDYRKRWTADMLLNHPFIINNLKNLSSDEKIILRQELDISKKIKKKKPWMYSKGMFSTTPLEVDEADMNSQHFLEEHLEKSPFEINLKYLEIGSDIGER